MWARVVGFLRLGEEETVSESQVFRWFLSSLADIYRIAQNGIKPCASSPQSVFRPKEMETVTVTHQSRTASRLPSTSSVFMYPPALPSSSNHGVGQGVAHNKSVCVIEEKQKSEVKFRLISLLSRALSSL